MGRVLRVAHAVNGVILVGVAVVSVIIPDVFWGHYFLLPPGGSLSPEAVQINRMQAIFMVIVAPFPRHFRAHRRTHIPGNY